MDSKKLEQRDIYESFENAGELQWTVLHEVKQNRHNIMTQFSVMVPLQCRLEIFNEDFKPPDLDYCVPKLVEANAEDGLQYLRYGDENGCEPLVILQQHYDLLPPMLPQLSEEFHLFHNLYVDKDGRELIKVNIDGSRDIVAKIDLKHVKVLSTYLRQFLAAKQMDLLLRIDSVLYVDDPDEEASLGETDLFEDRNDLHVSITVSDYIEGRERPLSHLRGWKLLVAPPRSKAEL